jgi:hypothetical protein
VLHIPYSQKEELMKNTQAIFAAALRTGLLSVAAYVKELDHALAPFIWPPDVTIMKSAFVA